MRRIAVTAIVAAASAIAGAAHAADADWKAYGFPVTPDGATVCFYDTKTTARPPTGRIRVWTKCLVQADLDNYDITKEFGGVIVKNAAEKMVKGYVPPLALVQDISYDQATMIAGYEETANIADLRKTAQFFYELNCSERQMRRLSTYVRAGGKEGFSDKPSEWEYVPPEGAGANLLRILCDFRPQ